MCVRVYVWERIRVCVCICVRVCHIMFAQFRFLDIDDLLRAVCVCVCVWVCVCRYLCAHVFKLALYHALEFVVGVPRVLLACC